MPKKILLSMLIAAGFLSLFVYTQRINNKNGEVLKEEAPSSPSPNPETEKTMTLEKPELIIDKSKKYQAILSTSEGEITIDLNVLDTPLTANNFVYLARSNFYDNTIFHRVIKDFMIQGGDPKGDGTGGPGYKFDDEKVVGEYKRGTVAMANSGPNTNGSQFFIMHKDYPLQKDYVIFGQVTKGIEVVDKIAESRVGANAYGEPSSPVSPVSVLEVLIVEK